MSFKNNILFRYCLKKMYIFYNFNRHYFLTDIILFSYSEADNYSEYFEQQILNFGKVVR